MSKQRHKLPRNKWHGCIQCKAKIMRGDMLPVKGRAGRICKGCIFQNERALGIHKDPWTGSPMASLHAATFRSTYTANSYAVAYGNIFAANIKVKP